MGPESVRVHVEREALALFNDSRVRSDPSGWARKVCGAILNEKLSPFSDVRVCSDPFGWAVLLGSILDEALAR